MTHDVIGHVVFKQQISDAMDGGCAIERVVNRASSDVASANVAVEMEMDGVTTEAVRLAHVCQFHMFNTGFRQPWYSIVNENLRTKFVTGYFLTIPAPKTCLGKELVCNDKHLRRVCMYACSGLLY